MSFHILASGKNCQKNCQNSNSNSLTVVLTDTDAPLNFYVRP